MTELGAEGHRYSLSAPPHPCSFSYALSCSLYYLIISEGEGFPSCIIGRFQDIVSATLGKALVMLQKWEASQLYAILQICIAARDAPARVGAATEGGRSNCE